MHISIDAYNSWRTLQKMVSAPLKGHPVLFFLILPIFIPWKMFPHSCNIYNQIVQKNSVSKHPHLPCHPYNTSLFEVEVVQHKISWPEISLMILSHHFCQLLSCFVCCPHNITMLIKILLANVCFILYILICLPTSTLNELYFFELFSASFLNFLVASI